MSKVLFIAYYFPPVGGAGVQRSLKFVQYLPQEGFVPTVITGPTSPDHQWTPHDKSLMESIPPGVPVHRVEGGFPDLGGRTRERLEKWLGVPSLFAKWWIGAATELALRVTNGEELIFASMSPFESGEVARLLSQRLGIPWVADLRDPWALDEMQVYPSRLHRRLEMLKMERLLSTAELIIMNTPEAAKALKSAFPRLRTKRVVAITNGFDRSDFIQAVAPRGDGKFRIVHSGYLHTEMGFYLRNKPLRRILGAAHSGVDILTRSHAVLLKALEQWRHQRPEIAQTVELVLAGKMSAGDRALAEQSAIAAMIQFPGYLPHAKNTELVRTADLLFLPMHNLPQGTRSRIVPGKTYEYMAAGRPVLAAVPDGDARDFLSQTGTALICRPDDADGMVRILDHVYSEWKRGGAVASCNQDFVKQFERRNLTRALADGFQSLLQPVPRHAITAASHATAS